MSLESRSQAYSEGDNLLHFGMGWLNGWGVNSNNNSRSGSTPLMVATFEHGIHEYVSIGAYLGFHRWYHTSNHTGTYYFGNDPTVVHWEFKETHNTTLIGLRGSFHFGDLLGTVDEWDPYAGIGLGTRLYRSKGRNQGDYIPIEQAQADYTNRGAGGVDASLYLGSRYYFRSSFCVWFEAGVPLRGRGFWAEIGVGFKI